MTSETSNSDASYISIIVDGMKTRKALANSIESENTENVFIYNVSGLFLQPKVMNCCLLNNLILIFVTFLEKNFKTNKSEMAKETNK